MKGEVTSEVEASQEGEKETKKSLFATPNFKLFFKRYPKRYYLNWYKTLEAWHGALARGWLEEDMLEALKCAAERGYSRAAMPNGDEFISQEHMREFLPPKRLAERFPEDADYYAAVAAAAAVEKDAEKSAESVVKVSTRPVKASRVQASSRFEQVVGCEMDLPSGEVV